MGWKQGIDIVEGFAEAGSDSDQEEQGREGRQGPGQCKRLKPPRTAEGNYEDLCMWMRIVVRDETGKGLGRYTIDNLEPWKVFK